jgi:hypothetical protein
MKRVITAQIKAIPNVDNEKAFCAHDFTKTYTCYPPRWSFAPYLCCVLWVLTRAFEFAAYTYVKAP